VKILDQSTIQPSITHNISKKILIQINFIASGNQAKESA